MMDMKIDVSKAIASLKRKSKKLEADLIKNFKVAGDEFIDDIAIHQMSGRPGLNAPTGTLRRSWFRKVRGSLSSDIILSVATRTKYAAVHEYGKQQVPGHTVKNYFRRTSKGYTKSGRKRRFGKISVGVAKGGLVRVRSHYRKPHTRIYPIRLHVRSRWQIRGRFLFQRAILRSYRSISDK